ncbi:MAG: hypothetical protein GXO40_03445 [Epsilonproteobacteria bacterium]|nr:hypothetical protein [Campylobacterota bacterium]
MIELLVVIVVMAVLFSLAKMKIYDTSLIQAGNMVISHIRYTRELSANDNKFQYYPRDVTSAVERNRTKYWFKQWWHIKFTNMNDHIIYYIFSDQPTSAATTNFNNTAQSQFSELATNPLDGKYLIGASGAPNYPSKDKVVKQLDLTQYYGIHHIKLDGGYSSSSMPNNLGDRINILFDSRGNIYMSEGLRGDSEDTNPYDSQYRHPLLQEANISLCKDTQANECIVITIEPKTGMLRLNR